MRGSENIMYFTRREFDDPLTTQPSSYIEEVSIQNKQDCRHYRVKESVNTHTTDATVDYSKAIKDKEDLRASSRPLGPCQRHGLGSFLSGGFHFRPCCFGICPTNTAVLQ